MLKSASGTIEKPGTNVAQKRGLNRSISQQGWGEFRTRLEQKAQAATTETIVVAANPAYTSQQCNQCGHTDKANRESQAAFECATCGHTSNADVNAAMNIRDDALTVVSNAAGLAVSGRGDSVLTGSAKRQPLKQKPSPKAAVWKSPGFSRGEEVKMRSTGWGTRASGVEVAA